MKHILFILAGLVFWVGLGQTALVAQQITGRVVDEQQAPLAYTTVALRQMDSTLVAGHMTDTLGVFSFQAPKKGGYLLTFMLAGYDGVERSIQVESDIMVETVVLKETVFQMEELVVTAKPTIRMRSDGLSYSVAGSVLAKNNNSWEVLKHAPMVQSSGDDVSILGKSGTVYYINGKPSKMNTTAMRAYLKGLPASQISRFDIITAPDVSYQGSGNFGVINVTILKPETDGFYGYVTLADYQASHNSQQAYANFDIRKGKWGTHATLYGSLQKTEMTQLFEQTLDASGAYTTGDQQTLFNHKEAGGTLEMKYQLSDRQELGAVLGLEFFDKADFNTSQYQYASSQGALLDSTSQNTLNALAPGHDISGSLLYSLKTDNKGSALDLDVSYLNYSNKRSSENAFHTFSDRTFTQNTPYNNQSLAATAKFRQMLSSKANITVGTEWYRAVTHTKDQFHSASVNYQNDFIFDETLLSFYAVYAQVWTNKLSTSLGMRAEYSYYTGEHTVEGLLLNEHYWKAYPSFSASYRISNNHSLSLALQYRLQRPSFNDLNPYITYQSPTSLTAGNPFLKPRRMMAYQLNYVYKYRLFVNLSYLKVLDNITSYTLPYEDNITITKKINASTARNPRLTISYRNQFFNNRWETNLSTYGQYVSNDIRMDSEKVIQDFYNYAVYFDNTVVLWPKKDLKVNVYVGYESRTRSDTYVRDPFWYANVSLMMHLSAFDIRLTAQDVFRTQFSRSRNHLFGVNTYTNSYMDNQRVMLVLSYYFGNKKVKKVGYMPTGSSTVKQRL